MSFVGVVRRLEQSNPEIVITRCCTQTGFSYEYYWLPSNWDVGNIQRKSVDSEVSLEPCSAGDKPLVHTLWVVTFTPCSWCRTFDPVTLSLCKGLHSGYPEYVELRSHAIVYHDIIPSCIYISYLRNSKDKSRWSSSSKMKTKILKSGQMSLWISSEMKIKHSFILSCIHFSQQKLIGFPFPNKIQ